MTPFAHVIYCDDIRQELGGKQTLVGVYSGTLQVQSFPVILPKLCLALQLLLPAEGLPKDLKIEVLQGDAVIAEGEFPMDDLQAAVAALEAEKGVASPEGDRPMLGVQFIFSPIRLEGPGTIRPRVRMGEQEIVANGLRIAQVADNA